MNRRTVLSSLSYLAAAAPLNFAAAARRPNIVLILADDLGWGDVSMNQCPDIQTPNIDSLARQGVRFTQFYANAPECTPTRCALLTGRYQQRVGGLECAIGVSNLGRYDEAEWLQKRGELGLPAGEFTLARALKSRGYATACFGKWHLGYHEKFGPLRHGFDEYFGPLGGSADYFTHQELGEGAGQSHLYDNTRAVKRKGYLTDLLTDAAVDWLKKRTAARPFFLYLPYNAPHTPIQDPAGLDPSTGTAPHRQGHRPTFARMVARLDECVGRVMRQLEATGMAEETIVVFTSDNGGDGNGRNLPYRGSKSSLWEGGIRVPCAIRWTSRIPAGSTCTQPGLTMDLMPTFLSAAGFEMQRGRPLDGIDLLPYVRGTRSILERTVFWRYKRGTARRKAIRAGDWKLINDSGSEWLSHLADDEREQTNRLATESGIANQLRAQLAQWEEAVRAPRLADFSPAR